MSDTVLLTDVQESGEFLTVHCDRQHVYAVYCSYGEEKLYLVIADKFYNVERTEDLDPPPAFFEYLTGDIKFKPPIQYRGGFKLTALIAGESANYKVTITDVGELTLIQTEERISKSNSSCALVESLKDLTIIDGVQRGNRYYFIAEEVYGEDAEAVYGVVDLMSGKAETLYYLYSDKGEVKPASISIDHHDRQVYVVGRINEVNDGVVTGHIPYFETFSYKG